MDAIVDADPFIVDRRDLVRTNGAGEVVSSLLDAYWGHAMSHDGRSSMPRGVIVIAALVAGRGCVCFDGGEPSDKGCELSDVPCEGGGDACAYGQDDAPTQCSQYGGVCVASVAVCDVLMPAYCGGAGVCCQVPFDATFETGTGVDAEPDAAEESTSDAGSDGEDEAASPDVTAGDGAEAGDAGSGGGDATDS